MKYFASGSTEVELGHRRIHRFACCLKKGKAFLKLSFASIEGEQRSLERLSQGLQ